MRPNLAWQTFVAWTLSLNHLVDGTGGYKLIHISESFLELSSTPAFGSMLECFAFCLIEANCLVAIFTDGICRSLDPNSVEVVASGKIPAFVDPVYLGGILKKH